MYRELETPPRAWGRPKLFDSILDLNRNTPTGVGKTHTGRPNKDGLQKHPHGRGEDPASSRGSPMREETPPRAWGRRSPDPFVSYVKGKHPHGRGEDTYRNAQ